MKIYCMQWSAAAMVIYLLSPVTFVQAGEGDAPAKVYRLSLKETTQMALVNSLDIQLTKYDAWIARTGQQTAESIYDTLFEAEVKYRNDRSKKTSTIFGSKTVDNDYNIGLSKKIPTGTTLSVDLDNNRHFTNSAFTTAPLTHDSRLGATMEQALGRNFLGIQDRGDIKIALLDIENAQYTSLDKIEESIAEVQRSYWDLVLHMEKVNIEEAMVAALPKSDLKDFRTFIGSIENERGFDPNARRGSHLAQITVFLTPFQTREKTTREISDEIRQKLPTIKGFEKLYIFQPKPGPPVGRAVSVGIKGEDFTVIQNIAAKFSDYLTAVDGVSDVETSYQFGKKQFKIIVDEEKTRKYFLDVEQVASSVRAAFKGRVATTVKPLKAEKEIDVVVRFAQEDRGNFQAFEKILLANRMGNLVPLTSVAEVVEEEGVYAINHLDGKRVVYVQAEVDDDKITSLEVNRMLREQFSNIASAYLGYTVKYSGEFERQMESLENIMFSFLLAVGAIFIILTAMFNSLIQPFIVMLAIPFGFIGVIFAFLAHGQPMSFFGLIGMVGLTGVVVNDSIVLVDFINRMRKEGRGRRESLIEAGRLRLRPVLMTTLTTVGGLVSVAYGIGGGDPFLKPLALAILWGLVFSTVLTLIIIPCIYAVLDDFTEHVLRRHMVKTVT